MQKNLIYFFLYVIFVNGASLFAQNEPNRIKNSDQEDIKFLLSLSDNYYQNVKTNPGNKDSSFVAFLHQNNVKDSAELQFALGHFHYSQQHYLKATRHFLIANEYLKREENNLLNAEIVFHLANSYQRLFFLRKAIDYYQIALGNYQKYLSAERKNRIIMDIGNSFYDLNQYNSAQQYYTQALESSIENDDNLNQTVALINIGNLNMVLKNYSVADSITRKALALSKIYNFDHLEVMCKFNFGELHFLMKDFGTTRNLFNQVLKEAEKVSFDRLIPEVYKYFVIIELQEKNYNKAVKFSTDFYNQSDKFVVQEKKIRAIKKVNNALNQMNNIAGASENFTKNIQLLDSILFKEIEEKRLLMESLQQLTVLEGDYKDLVNENNLKEEKLLRFRIVIVLILFILLLTTFFIIQLTKSRNRSKKQSKTIQKQYEDIKKKNQETEELNHEINMQSEEIQMQNDQLLTTQQELEKRIEKRTKDLQHALEKAKESDDLKSSFLQNISHEIRTPLNAISGFAQLIASDENTDSSYSAIITQNVYDLIDIIDSIILFSKLQANQYNFSVSEMPVFRILKQLHGDFSLIKNKYKLKEIEFIINNQLEEDQVLKTDISLLQKVLIQLVENAFKFTEKGSVTMNINKQADKLLFAITDTGIGIKKDKIPFIFDTFRKLEGEQIFRGTGIGLALVKKIVELLNGEISLVSKFGKGTTIKTEFSIN